MTSEELFDALSNKMRTEQEQFKAELLRKPPEEILRGAYAYWVREDMILAAEGHYLSNEHLAALLKLDQPLNAAYQEFMDTDRDTLSPIVDSLESLAETELRAEERETSRPSIREQLKAGGSLSAPDHAGRPPVPER